MRKPFPTIALLILSICLRAVGADARDGVAPDTVYWNDGRIDWSDFTPYYSEKGATYRVYPVPDTIYHPKLPQRPYPVRDYTSYRSFYDFLDEQDPDPVITLEHGTGVRFVKRQEGNLRYIEGLSFTYMLKSKSRYDINRCDSWGLRYSQVQFDIVETVRRQFVEVSNLRQVDRAASAYYKDLETAALRTFRMESSYGRDTAVIRRYEERYASILDSLAPNTLYEAGSINCIHGFYMELGLCYEHFIDGLPGELITSPGAQMGMGYNFKNLSFQLNMNYCSVGHVPYTPFHYDSELDYQWRNGRKVTCSRTLLNIGYRVWDKPYIAIAPFVGAGFLSLSQETDIPNSKVPDRFINSDLYGQYYRFGLILDWKLLRSLGAGIGEVVTLSNYNRVYSEQKIRFQLYGALTHLDGIGTGYSVGMSVAFHYDTWINKRQ